MIYKPKNTLTGDKKTQKKNYCKDMDMMYDLKEVKDCKKQISKIEGSYLGTLIIDGKMYFNLDEDRPRR